MVWGDTWGLLGRTARVGATAAVCAVLAQCGSGAFSKIDPRLGVSASPRVVGPDEPVPKGGGRYQVGKPYTVGGRLYVPEEDPDYKAEGLASWYGDDFHGRLTANGEVFDMHSLSAAHPTLPMPSYVRVTNLDNGRSMVVRVNDRGPYHRNRVIDVSHKAADMLGFKRNGTGRVRVEYVGRAPLDGDDDGILMATLREGRPAPAPSGVMIAASRPFLPASLRGKGGGAVRGNVPVPPDRPFELGLADRQAPPSRRYRDTAREADTAVASAREVDNAGAPPVTAFAATGNGTGVLGTLPVSVMTGRGLY